MEQARDGEQFDEPSSYERHSNRDSLFLQAVLSHPALREPVTVRVRNLSAGGMMAECAGAFAEDDSIGIELRGIGTITGRIAWIAEGRLGIAFDHEVDPMLARKPVGQGSKGVPIPGPVGQQRRPGFRGR